MSELNIYQRINAVMKKVKYVQKDAKIQGYKAVTHDQVTSVLRQAMVDEGIVVEVRQDHGELLVTKDEKNKMHLYCGVYAVELVNIDNPSDRTKVIIESHANDNGDKAPGKALSYAVKNALLKIFSLETGENDESRTEVNATLTPTQIKGVNSLIGGDTDLEARVLASLNIESVEEIRKADYNRVIARLKKSKGAQ
jgi:hypothetical protein